MVAWLLRLGSIVECPDDRGGVGTMVLATEHQRRSTYGLEGEGRGVSERQHVARHGMTAFAHIEHLGGSPSAATVARPGCSYPSVLSTLNGQHRARKGKRAGRNWSCGARCARHEIAKPACNGQKLGSLYPIPNGRPSSLLEGAQASLFASIRELGRQADLVFGERSNYDVAALMTAWRDDRGTPADEFHSKA
ncbi:hypothetical protein R1flu_008865 [Riccia fluitans]|uniref:Uncharacterized protein n=1 Tax=Riccia fluitans TaxID=41844 RepID=A0ABD1Z0F0_9MARC